jgi:hypothetical protein
VYAPKYVHRKKAAHNLKSIACKCDMLSSNDAMSNFKNFSLPFKKAEIDMSQGSILNMTKKI